MAPGNVAVLGADGESRRDREVRQTEPRECAAHQFLTSLGGTHCIGHVKVQDGAARVLALQVILHFKRQERIVRKAHREVRAVGVVRIRFGTCLNIIREALSVFLGKAVRCAFSRRSFEVLDVSRFFLEFNHSGTDMIQKL